ncbi:MAG: hypothetical protein U5K71_09765 [Gracilimonas sp.]|nr:hypothetical protein [Gracilimonas sp.]
MKSEKALADIVKKITVKYDNVFKVSFPYSAGFRPGANGWQGPS